MSKEKRSKQKKIGHQLIQDEGRDIYKLMADLITQNHPDLVNARIALAWNLSWRPDVDGRLTLVKCKLASDLDRELSAFDFVIVLYREFWKDPQVTDKQRAALIDHGLSHGALALDKNQEPIEDEKGRKCYRTRKHDIEEFARVVERHGLYMKELELFAKSLMKGRQQALEFENDGAEASEQKATRPGTVPFPTVGEGRILG